MSEEKPLIEQVGFNYAQALRDLLTKMTNIELSERIGYSSVGSINDIMRRGRNPNHPHGEALWALYIDTFGRKPPIAKENAKEKTQAATENTLAPSDATP